MTADSQWDLQVGIDTALRADATLIALLSGGANGIYDFVPAETTYPYVVIGESTGAQDDTKSEDGMNQTVTIHTWSRDRGFEETKRIMAAIVDALDAQPLTVTGHTLIRIWLDFSDTLRDPDGLTYHGIQRFRALTEAT